jgi:protein-disulfide isomerase
MKLAHTAGVVLLLTSSACLFGQESANAGLNTVIAEVGGQQLTLGGLEQNMATRLFQARQQYYQAERAALEQWIDEQLLANEAHRQNITVEQLLDRNVTQLVKDPTEDQMRVYFEGVNTKEAFESMSDKILQHIREIRAAKLRTALIESLRQQLGVKITFVAPKAAVSVSSSPVLGAQNASIQLVEFGDYQCPYCQQAYPIVKQLLENYGAKVAFSFRDLPLPMHPQAPKAAEAARCAGVQGKYWEFYSSLFSTKQLEIPAIKEQAKKLALETSAFDKCLDAGDQAAAVAKDASEGQRLQLTGTPTFFINGHLFDGPLKYQALRDAIDKELGVAPSREVTNGQASIR